MVWCLIKLNMSLHSGLPYQMRCYLKFIWGVPSNSTDILLNPHQAMSHTEAPAKHLLSEACEGMTDGVKKEQAPYN